jgi:hypothetical protein
MADATIAEVRNYFGMPTKEFATEWKKLSDKDKTDLKKGIGDGTLNY